MVKKNKPYTTFKDEYYVQCYLLSKSGMSERRIAKTLGVEVLTLRRWRLKNPAFDKAIADGKNSTSRDGAETFQEYVYSHLPEHLRHKWDKISTWEKEDNGERRIAALLAQGGKRTTQRLFVHALIQCNFNASEACRIIQISRRRLEAWIETDPDFHAIIDEINWHKGNFFEAALVGLVKQGSEAATLFANRTFNRDRGYNEKVTVEGNVNHNHNVNVTVDDLSLPLSVKKKILRAMRKRKELKDGIVTVQSKAIVPISVRNIEEAE